MNRNILLQVQFDGTDFHGWQHQPGQRTVQATLGDTLREIVHHPLTLYGSSRTDAGVHARSMPVNFETSSQVPCRGIVRGLNALLPEDLSVLDAREVPAHFRARHAALAKTYTYRFLVGSIRRPLVTRYAWWVRRRALDLDAMREAAQRLVGHHDFSAFRASDCASHSTRRWIYETSISPEDDERVVTFTVTGNAFLRNMVRIMAGTLAEVGWGRRPATSVSAALGSGDRRDAGLTAPASGLTLTKVHFEGYPRVGKPPLPPSRVEG